MLIPVAGVLLLTWLALWLSTRATRRIADRMGKDDNDHLEEIEHWAKQLTALLRKVIAGVAAVAATLIILRSTGIRGIPALTWEEVFAWMMGPGLRILLVLGGAWVLSRMARLVISRMPVFVVPKYAERAETQERQRRAQTVSRLLSHLVTAVLMSISGLIVLRELGVDIMPILTGAGIVGLAVGFGAQNLVRDVISGFFIILENQIRVGDIAVINGRGGLVEAINLRTTVTRGFDGTVHIFPNGAIEQVSNMTKDFSYYVIELGVAYKENVDQVMSVLRDIGAELERDAAFANKILAPLEIVGVDQFANSAVVIKMRIKTVPLEQFTVGRELRRRIKNTFDAKGIEIPYPHLSLYFGDASRPVQVEMAEKVAAMEAAAARSGSSGRNG